MQIMLKCNTQTKINEDGRMLTNEGKILNFNEGECYIADSQSIDKTAWFLRDQRADAFAYVSKWMFMAVVRNTLTHKAYGSLKLPVIGVDGQSYICLSPTGYVTHIHQLDALTYESLDEEYLIPSEEVRFR